MTKMPYIIIGAAVILGALLLAGYRKKAPPSTDEIDGGVRTDRMDPDAPKTVVSTEITEFNCVFSTVALDTSHGFEGKVYDLEARVKDGMVYGHINYYDRNGAGSKKSFETDLRFMESLYELVARNDLAKHNGCSYFVSGLPDMYGAKISIGFASGESIYASNNQSNFLGVDAMGELVALFETVAESEVDGALWQGMNFYRNHSEWNRCFNLTVTTERDGSMSLRGFCNGSDGKEYSNEEGFVMSKEAVLALRDMELDKLPEEKKKPSLGFQVMDETVQKLILTYAEGRKTEKELSDDTLSRALGILHEEFKTQQ